jgi:hypothetical protein
VLDLAGEALRAAGRLEVQQVGERRCRFSSSGGGRCSVRFVRANS